MTMPPDIAVLGVCRSCGCFSRISTEAPSSAPARAAAAPAPPYPMTTISTERSQASAIRPAPFTAWWAYAGTRSRRERQPGHVTEGDARPQGGPAAWVRRAEDAGHRVPGAEQPQDRRPVHRHDLCVGVDHRAALRVERSDLLPVPPVDDRERGVVGEGVAGRVHRRPAARSPGRT